MMTSGESPKTSFSVPETVLTAALAKAAELALQGPVTGGNPRVGCVILRGDQILATGYHRGAGTPHAEADALAQCRTRGIDPAGATAVVTLEPCNHYGRTPACSLALIEAGITEVIYAAADPNPRATGGAEALRQAGVRVADATEAGLDPQVIAKAQAVTAQWRLVMERKIPWVIAKTAASLDGKIAAKDGSSKWITGAEARAHAHRHLRGSVDAIIVGTGTALADNPALTFRPESAATVKTEDDREREGSLGKQPLPVVIGERDLPADLQVKKREYLHLKTHDLQHALSTLFERGCRRVLIEGGAGIISAALAAALVDEWWYYLAPLALGEGKSAVDSLGVETLTQACRWEITHTEKVGEDLYLKLEKPCQTKEEKCSRD